MTDGLNWNSLVGGVALLGILCVLSFAAIAQQNHDALVALISALTGAGIGASSVAVRQPASAGRPDALDRTPSPEAPSIGS